jgi:pimeloyl-ACP methyl ester carboxylesterase
MPFANNKGIRIHYELEGADVPLILQHGFTNSLESWYENGYVETLKRDYTLILEPSMMRQGAAAIPAIWGAPLSAALRTRLLANDIEAIRASRVDDPGYEDILPTMRMPCLLFAGDADRVCPLAKAAAARHPPGALVWVPF